MALCRYIAPWLLLVFIVEITCKPTEACDFRMTNQTKQRKSTGDTFMTEGTARGESARFKKNKGPSPIDGKRNRRSLNLCRPGYFGPHCDKECPANCGLSGNSRNCDSDGKCTDGCEAGHWGDFCNATCDHCVNNTCMFTDGMCLRGCKAGYFGKNCDKICSINCNTSICPSLRPCSMECTSRNLRESCMNDCRSKCDGLICNDEGVCTHGCISGFKGKCCKEPCPRNCVTCSEKRSICLICESGFLGVLCENPIEPGHPFLQVLNVIGIVFLVLIIVVVLLAIASVKVRRQMLSFFKGIRTVGFGRTLTGISLTRARRGSDAFTDQQLSVLESEV